MNIVNIVVSHISRFCSSNETGANIYNDWNIIVLFFKSRLYMYNISVSIPTRRMGYISNAKNGMLYLKTGNSNRKQIIYTECISS